MPSQPTELPDGVEPSDPLRAALRRAAEGTFDDDLRIEFRVSGGVGAQKYRLMFEAAAEGLAGELECELSKRRASVRDDRSRLDVLKQLSRKLLDGGLLDELPKPPRFLPDTLVGKISVTAGGRTHVVYFAAEPDQASVQDAVPSPATAAAAAALYAAAAEALNIKDVAP